MNSVKNQILCKNTAWKNYNADNPTADICQYANDVHQTIYCPENPKKLFLRSTYHIL